MRILVVAAHPDDEILGVGATVARHVAAGDSVTSLLVADGASSRYPDGAHQTLQACARRAAEVLGVRDIRFLGLKDQRLDAMPILEVIRAVERVVSDVAPEVVYTHHWGDLNRDHRVVSEAVLVACRPVGESYPRRLLCFETPSSSEWSTPDPQSQFAPTSFVDIGASLDVKLSAMACYPTELRPPPHPRGLDSLRSRAKYWGQLVSLDYAEPFAVVREVL